jgi:2'-5' RNA ligase
MAYGIGLIFDHHTEARIREVWGKLARQGLVTPLARPGCLPHVSLILSETLRVDDLTCDLERLAATLYQQEVRFSCVGVFTEPEIVLFYGLTPTNGLLRLHTDVARIYRRWSSTIISRSESGVWVPHCTLAGRVDADRLADAIAAAATLPLPWVATPVGLAIVRFDPARVELLYVIPGWGAPGCRAGIQSEKQPASPNRLMDDDRRSK